MKKLISKKASPIPPSPHKAEKRQWRHNLPTWRHRHFLDIAMFLLSNLVIGPSFVSISWCVLEFWQFSLIKDWQEIGNTPVCVLPNIWRLGRVWDTRFICNKMLLNAAKCQGYSWSVFELLRKNQEGEGGGTPSTRLGLRRNPCINSIPIPWKLLLAWKMFFLTEVQVLCDELCIYYMYRDYAHSVNS